MAFDVTTPGISPLGRSSTRAGDSTTRKTGESMMAMGFSELIIVLLAGGVTGGTSFLGYPPGERDAALVRTAPADSLVYLEWATRSPGQPGADGIDGLAADPEIRLFLEQVEKAILVGIERSTEGEDRRPARSPRRCRRWSSCC